MFRKELEAAAKARSGIITLLYDIEAITADLDRGTETPIARGELLDDAWLILSIAGRVFNHCVEFAEALATKAEERSSEGSPEAYDPGAGGRTRRACRVPL